MRRALLLAAPILCISLAYAALPVIDAAQLLRWGQQFQQMEQQLQQLEAEVRMLQDVPKDLITQVEQLLAQGIQNPLANIQQNIQGLMNGTGVGSCNGAQNTLTETQYMPAQGGDFTASWLNQSANRNAGLQACTQQMMQGVSTRLANLQPLLDELQGSHDITQVNAVSGRIQYEMANIQAQNQQINTLSTAAMLQHQMAEDQELQKMRHDAEERFNATGGGGAAPGAALPAIQAPPPFVAAGN